MGRPVLLLLGPPRLERDGEPVEVDTRKAIALLAYVAVTRQPQSRDTLAALLWPDYGQTRARAALRRTLSALNGAVGADVLAIDRESVALALDRGAGPPLIVDVDRFRGLLANCTWHGHGDNAVCSRCLPPLAEAVQLYRDDFLTGFTFRDSPTFDEWQYFQADTLRRDLANALERLTEGHSQHGEWHQAIGYARRWLLLDPLHEPAHRRLMQLHTWAGDRAAALRQFRECERVLEQELGVTPLEATLELHASIKENRLAPPAALAAATPGSLPVSSSPARMMPLPPAAGPPPLVGRSTELATLQATYQRIMTDGQLVVVEGEAGIGKTRLAEEFIAHLKGTGARSGAAATPARPGSPMPPLSERLPRRYGRESGLSGSTLFQLMPSASSDVCCLRSAGWRSERRARWLRRRKRRALRRASSKVSVRRCSWPAATRRRESCSWTTSTGPTPRRLTS